ncbi:hypothetical protein QQX10_01900 [Demequina sp. SYSU T00039]|uniref:Uncharacterized protein n=1 Tax=Demequina lignilytica TaxID=3051663 RepID=A0AAW7M0Z0_9MICO|nr:hypothetical protein [Demequina sp. SYSU T00039]MDN4486914.1 hypothetical protein [Demequina sp. SYSU T00039]
MTIPSSGVVSVSRRRGIPEERERRPRQDAEGTGRGAPLGRVMGWRLSGRSP